jgi:hypothetical protein
MFSIDPSMQFQLNLATTLRIPEPEDELSLSRAMVAGIAFVWN